MKIEKYNDKPNLTRRELETYQKMLERVEKVHHYLLNDDLEAALRNSKHILPSYLGNWKRGEYYENWDSDDNLDQAIQQLLLHYVKQIIQVIKTTPAFKNNDLGLLCWIVADLLGTKPDIALNPSFDEEMIALIATRIAGKKYKDYPFVILARYVPKAETERFARLVIDYGSVEKRMDWAMAQEACLTLSYLNALPEESIIFWGEKLIAGGCDDMPYEGALEAIPYFYQYADLILDNIIESFRDVSTDSWSYFDDYFSMLSKIILTKTQAEKLLPAFTQNFISHYFADDLIDFSPLAGIYDAPPSSVMQFYGQLQLLINLPQCVKPQ